ncbi:MAG: META domain-containing protein [Jejuia sp.]
MKMMLLCCSVIVLRCCWGPTDYQVMQQLKNDETILKTFNGTYHINTLNQEDVSAFNLEVSFNDSTNKVSGFSGCNRFFGSYTLNENSLKFGALGATKMLCSEDKNAIETKLFKALDKADTVFFHKNGFVLFNNRKPLLSAIKLAIEKNISFEYYATSRGTYKKITIEKDSISFSKKRGGKTLQLPCAERFWKNLTKLCDSLDIKNIGDLEAPSKSFQFDGASLARLKITLNGETYESAPFDHGNPPKEIEALVKEILSSTENIE